MCTLFTLSNSPGLWSTTRFEDETLRFTVEHQHHAHSFELPKSTAAPAGSGPDEDPPARPAWSPPSLASPPGTGQLLCVRAGGFAPWPGTLVSGSLLRVQKEKAVSLLCRQHGMGRRPLYCSTWHRKMLSAKGTGRGTPRRCGVKTALFEGPVETVPVACLLACPQGLVNPSKADNKRGLKTSVQKIL